MTDDATGVTIVFNGEVFNYVELRRRLSVDYPFKTHSDTEVILAAFLERGIGCVDDFNGQFAFAIHDPRDGTLWLARDRFGERPLFYSQRGRTFAFASEAKALFSGGFLEPRLDARSLVEAVHLWAPSEGRSAFEGVSEVPPGTIGRVRNGQLTLERYWEFNLSDDRIDRSLTPDLAADELESLLEDAVRLRLRADVPVAAYLSGGLDSSLLCAIAQDQLGGSLQTFSVAFEQDRFDERAFQAGVAEALRTEHHTVTVQDGEIGTLLPWVVEHAEAPLLRTAPAPLLKLSAFVRSSGTKVVLTGEGADELFLGYDLFKETSVRRFCARMPSSPSRARLFERLYPYLAVSRQSPEMIRTFFGAGADGADTLGVSHRLRWNNSGRVARFFCKEFVERVAGFDPIGAVLANSPPAVHGWRPLAKAQYLEVHTLLSQYLLSSQGDRMMMANSIEGRFPFLDHRVAEFAARLPDSFKLRGLAEKLILRRVASGRVPPQVLSRKKFPYRAPIADALVRNGSPAWASKLLTRDYADGLGVFDGAKVERLITKIATSPASASDADDMALAAISTTHLLAHAFLTKRTIPDSELSSVKVSAA